MHPAAPHQSPPSSVVLPSPKARASDSVVRPGGPFDPVQLLKSFPEALRKLHPRTLVRSPVLFVVAIGSVLTTLSALVYPSVLVFADLAEAVAEGRGRAQAESFRRARTDTVALRLRGWHFGMDLRYAEAETVPATELRLFDFVVVTAGDVIPADGDVVDGVAAVDESAVTGESAPVLRESGGDRSGVTGGTAVLSDRIVVRVTSRPGHSFLDRMIALVEGAARQKTPNEIVLNILLAALTLVFVLVVVAVQPMASYANAAQSTTILVALLVTLIPTTIGALLSAIGIAGMDRLVQRNVLAMSGRAVEAAGDVKVPYGGGRLRGWTSTCTTCNRCPPCNRTRHRTQESTARACPANLAESRQEAARNSTGTWRTVGPASGPVRRRLMVAAAAVARASQP